MEPEPLGKALGEQLRMLRVQRLQMRPEALWVGHAGLIMGFAFEGQADTLSPGWFHGSLHTAVCVNPQYGPKAGIIPLFSKPFHQPQIPVESAALRDPGPR